MNCNIEIGIDQLFALKEKTEREDGEIQAEKEGIRKDADARADAIRNAIYEMEHAKSNLEYEAESKIKSLDNKHNEMYKTLYDLKQVFMRRIALASLKHAIPDKFERYRSNYASDKTIADEIIYGTPLLSVIASYADRENATYNHHKVNKFSYSVNVWPHVKFAVEILQLAALDEMRWERHYSDKIHLYDNVFKTLEDAKAFNERNKDRLTKESVDEVKLFIAEVESASDDFESLFDFRLIFDDTIAYQDYKVLEKTKTTLKVYSENRNHENKRTITVALKGWGFTISGGDAKDAYSVMSAISKIFTLTHTAEKEKAEKAKATAEAVS